MLEMGKYSLNVRPQKQFNQGAVVKTRLRLKFCLRMATVISALSATRTVAA